MQSGQPAQSAQPAALPLQPMHIGTILPTLARFYVQNLVTLVGIVVGLQAPIVSALVMLGVLLVLIVLPLISGGIIHTISRTYLGHATSVRAAYAFGSGRIVNLIVANMLLNIIILLPVCVALYFLSMTFLSGLSFRGGPMADLFPVALVTVYVSPLASICIGIVMLFVNQSIVVEGKHAVAAIERSLRLVTRSFWRTLGSFFILLPVPALAALAIALTFFPSTIVFIYDPLNTFARNEGLVTLVAYGAHILALPLLLAIPTLLYYDVRIRTEGYDLDQLAQEMGQGGDAPAGPMNGG